MGVDCKVICTTLTLYTSQLTDIMKHFVALCASGILRLLPQLWESVIGGGGGVDSNLKRVINY